MSAPPKIRVLVVDDSAFARQAVSRMLEAAPDIEVVGVAGDGIEGLDKVKQLAPDVVTLDVNMPRLGGLAALERMMSECPSRVLLLSSVTQEGAEVTLRGLELGALDFIDKSTVPGSMNLLQLAPELQAKVRALAGAPLPAAAAAPPASVVAKASPAGRVEVVAIGASTGGPSALQAIVPRLPEGLGAALLVVQHMPPGFTRSLADRLDARSSLDVHEAADGEAIVPGVVLIAPAGLHMKARRRGSRLRVVLDEEPADALHRPSADVLMTSVAKAYGPRVLGIILTGMGNDGVLGLRAIRGAGGRSLAQSEDTCVIYGMPKAAVEAGVVERSVPLHLLADEIVAAV
jgi:two-component system chemotaxis response regulator CheB